MTEFAKGDIVGDPVPALLEPGGVYLTAREVELLPLMNIDGQKILPFEDPPEDE